MIYLLGDYRLPLNPSDSDLNYPFWTDMAERFGGLHVVGRGLTDHPVTSRQNNFHYTLLPDLGRARFAFSLSRWIRRQRRPSLLWSSDGATTAFAIERYARRHRFPVLVEVQGNYLNRSLDFGFRQRIARSLLLRETRRAQRIRVCSERHRGEFLERGFDPARVWTIPTRVDTELFNSTRYDREALRDSRRVQKGQIVLLTIGNLVRGKGTHHLIESLALLREHVVLWVIGDGPERESLERQTHDAGLARRVTFWGRSRHRDVPQAMAAADVFAVPSYNEGMPRVVVEAMAMGLPVVASDVGGIAEQLGEASEQLITPGSTHDLTAALARMVEEPAHRQSCATANLSRACSRYAASEILGRWERLLHECLGESCN